MTLFTQTGIAHAACMGLALRVLPRTIVGLERTMKAAGPVFTVRRRPDPTMDKHTSLNE